MFGGRFPQGADDVGQTLASFPTYERAQKLVQTLIAAEVPARDIAIVGLGLRSVERVTGRLGYATAARSGAINGLLLGLLFSAILVLGTTTVPIQAFVGVLFVGVAIGMLLSLITFAFVRRRRSYASVMQVIADHYEVTVASRSFQRARQAMSNPPASAASPARAADPSTPPASPAPTPPRSEVDAPRPEEPPRYGERLPSADGQTAQGSEHQPPSGESSTGASGENSNDPR